MVATTRGITWLMPRWRSAPEIASAHGRLRTQPRAGAASRSAPSKRACSTRGWLAAWVDVDDEEKALLDALRAADDEEMRAAVQLALTKHYEHPPQGSFPRARALRRVRFWPKERTQQSAA